MKWLYSVLKLQLPDCLDFENGVRFSKKAKLELFLWVGSLVIHRGSRKSIKIKSIRQGTGCNRQYQPCYMIVTIFLIQGELKFQLL